MTRPVSEWIGARPETPPPPRVKIRILARQEFRCAISGLPIPAGVTPEFDHEKALINGGENRESNLRAVLPDKHREKTKQDVAIKAKTNAMTAAAYNLDPPKGDIKSRGFPKKARPEKIAVVGMSNIARRFR